MFAGLPDCLPKGPVNPGWCVIPNTPFFGRLKSSDRILPSRFAVRSSLEAFGPPGNASIIAASCFARVSTDFGLFGTPDLLSLVGERWFGLASLSSRLFVKFSTLEY
jgi:hypothetical protein